MRTVQRLESSTIIQEGDISDMSLWWTFFCIFDGECCEGTFRKVLSHSVYFYPSFSFLHSLLNSGNDAINNYSFLLLLCEHFSTNSIAVILSNLSIAKFMKMNVVLDI